MAIVLAMTLVGNTGLSRWVMGAIVVLALLTFIALVAATKIATGEERIIYYHHEIAVMTTTAALLELLHQPVIRYLDITLLGIGMFLSCGRVGCLMVGCCHGRPARWGIRYRAEHAAAGFAPYLVGIRLFPIQAVESLWVLCVVAVGSSFVWMGRPLGTALAWYTIAYGTGRFGFEFARGDAHRPYLWGFSEAQWISLVLLILIVWAESSGRLPFQAWHVGVLPGVILTMALVAVARRFDRRGRYQLLHPHHVSEVARAIALVDGAAAGGSGRPGRRVAPDRLAIACTSLGIQISGGRVDCEGTLVRHYALSRRSGTMSAEYAATLSGLILRLSRSPASHQIVGGGRGVFHLLLRSPGGTLP
jgi:prolipoprotein diacylglyceryltransferase